MKKITIGKMRLNFISFKKKTNHKKPFIIHMVHHKCGVHWFGGIMREIAKKFKLKFQVCRQEDLKEDTDIWLFPFCDDSSQHTNLKKLNCLYTGTHMIRDPRDKIVSAYFYHLWTDEWWVNKKCDEISMSMQEFLKTLNEEEGLFVEMWALRNQLIWQHACWNFHDKNILELKYEDVLLDPEKWFPIIFKKWGFEEKDIPELMKIARKHHFTNKTGRKLGEEKIGEHLRQGMPGDWKKHFTPKIKKQFKDLFGDWLIKLGYEKDNNW